MGLFNHLFGGRRGTVEDWVSNRKERIKLFQEHLILYKRKLKKIKYFDVFDIRPMLENPDKLIKIINILREIEGTTSGEIIDLKGEKKKTKEIASELYSLSISGDFHFISMIEGLRNQEDIEKNLLGIFKTLYKALIIELHAIQIIIEKLQHINENSNKKDCCNLLSYLYNLINNYERSLYKTFFDAGIYYEPHVTPRVEKAIKGILLEEALEEKEQEGDKKFISNMVEKMGKQESQHSYRLLGEDIFQNIIDEAGAPFANVDEGMKGLEKIEAMIKDDKFLFRIIKKLRRKYSDQKVRLVMAAFRKAYDLLHFDDTSIYT